MDKSKNYIHFDINNDQEIFPNSWLYNIPLDLSSNSDSKILMNEVKENNYEKNIDNYPEKYLPKNLINILFEDDSEQMKQESFSKTIYNYNNIKETPRKKGDIVNNNFNSFYNYNINIYKPNINLINIYYPFSTNVVSNLTSDNNSQSNPNTNIILNRNSKINSNYMNHSLINKNVNFNVENCINNNDICVNYSKEKIKNQVNNSIKNKNPAKEKSNKQTKIKKPKKKRKKKIDDDYTIEILGRRGWICEKCQNFNYQSRKTCNRCKKIKTAINKSILSNEEGSKILYNLINGNNKKEWNCSLCGNVNYSFRIICNRCQNPKDIEEMKKIEDVIN